MEFIGIDPSKRADEMTKRRVRVLAAQKRKPIQRRVKATCLDKKSPSTEEGALGYDEAPAAKLDHDASEQKTTEQSTTQFVSLTKDRKCTNSSLVSCPEKTVSCCIGWKTERPPLPLGSGLPFELSTLLRDSLQTNWSYHATDPTSAQIAVTAIIFLGLAEMILGETRFLRHHLDALERLVEVSGGLLNLGFEGLNRYYAQTFRLSAAFWSRLMPNLDPSLTKNIIDSRALVTAILNGHAAEGYLAGAEINMQTLKRMIPTYFHTIDTEATGYLGNVQRVWKQEINDIIVENRYGRADRGDLDIIPTKYLMEQLLVRVITIGYGRVLFLVMSTDETVIHSARIPIGFSDSCFFLYEKVRNS
ncbi:hypothetical protein BP6252_07596 [Coleophoma cylindrospora]|uniref:Uncharacterized protein n=1 Tax=Coleophoma cylindrospora TaxID=1849047 RepID=A0A3D8RAF0_9HELO|nr:hypothetical protein BP6252_07596 [Coleophoma cylindrospora]